MPDIKFIPPRDDWRIVISKVLKVGTDLDNEFRHHAVLMGRASWFHADSKKRVRRLKRELDVLSARLRRRIRLSQGKLTNPEMDAAVERKKVFALKRQELEEAMYHDDLISGLVKALDYKKDCLVQISANARRELPDELRALADSLNRRYKSFGSK